MLKQQYSLSEWVEMFAYLRITGPVGPERKNEELAHLAMFAAGPHLKKVTTSDFKAWWDQPRLIND